MEWPSVFVVLNLPIIILFFAKVSSSMTVNYIKPFTSDGASPCSNTVFLLKIRHENNNIALASPNF